MRTKWPIRTARIGLDGKEQSDTGRLSTGPARRRENLKTVAAALKAGGATAIGEVTVATSSGPGVGPGFRACACS